MLVVLSAAGVDTAGMGPARSWALWQGTLVVVEMLLVSVYAPWCPAIDPGRGRAVGCRRYSQRSGERACAESRELPHA